MKICLAGGYSIGIDRNELNKSRFILESFYYFQDWQKPLIKSCDLFLLDSGAFTFLNKGHQNIEIDKYLADYINFINENDIKYFFELDIDSVVGYDKVKEYRRRLEDETGKQCIPVFHVARGKNEFIKMCNDYEYVAYGGLVTKEMSPALTQKYLSWFVNYAHSCECKIHGLGFTNLKLLPRIHFDSVDSTSWLSGRMFGKVYYFNGSSLDVHLKPENMKTTNYKIIEKHNLTEWIKFQNYADKFL